MKERLLVHGQPDRTNCAPVPLCRNALRCRLLRYITLQEHCYFYRAPHKGRGQDQKKKKGENIPSAQGGRCYQQPTHLWTPKDEEGQQQQQVQHATVGSRFNALRRLWACLHRCAPRRHDRLQTRTTTISAAQPATQDCQRRRACAPPCTVQRTYLCMYRLGDRCQMAKRTRQATWAADCYSSSAGSRQCDYGQSRTFTYSEDRNETKGNTRRSVQQAQGK